MTSWLPAGFLVAPCTRCERDVLTARDLGADGELVSVCIHCDGQVDASALQARDFEALDQLGYDIPGAPSPHGERGCRDGKCGVQQPDP